MRLLRVMLAAFAVSVFLPAPSTSIADQPESDSQHIVGCWLGSRKFSVFHANGTWGVKRHEDAPEEINGRRWRIKDKKLFLTYPDDGGLQTVAFTIVSLTAREMVLEVDGYKEEYTRYTPDCQNEA